jgi:hypothetical protein
MKRSSVARDILGTALMFFLLVVVTFAIMMGEKFLDNFKAH